MARAWKILGLSVCLALGACSRSDDAGPAAPGSGVVEPPVQERALLGSDHARSYRDEFCEGQPDSAMLPQDPRELIRPGVNAGRAVAFNAYWQDCTGPGDNPRRKPQSCGEYRSRVAAGETLMRSGLAMSFHGRGLIGAGSYNAMWQRWGLSARPADFDEQARRRYGLPKASFRNPYPLPGEDPVTNDGGSGELPAGLTQIKDAEGHYNGSIGITCDACHSGELRAAGSEFVSGLGANTSDLQLLLSDVLLPLLPIGLNDTRGVTNAEGLSGLLIGLLDLDSLGLRPDSAVLLQLPGNTSGGGDTKMPAWWNASHRPRKFWDGGFSYDASRLNSAILEALRPVESPLGMNKEFNRVLRDRIETQSLDAQAYIDSLRSPLYPGPVDENLAKAGAVLFHAKDLWGSGVNEDIPRPPTNGSCAGCHGVYAERYAHDPAYLEDPRLRGMAGYIAPIEQIRSDRQRLDGFTKPLLEVMSSSWFSYPEGSEGYVSPDEKNAVVERLDDLTVFTGTRVKGACTWQGAMPEDAVGYLTPPLHGVWATAPYLHNASVPDVWSLLDPEQRPAVWRRQLTQAEGEEGLDTELAAYDQQRLGWKHEALLCGAGGLPYVSCELENAPPAFTALVEFINTLPGTLNSLGYQVTQPLGRAAVRERMIFNSHQFAKRNTGHDFTRALSDPERRAIIEYLKTL
ncbi:hypothetical protein D0B54_23700 [Solimonas sp. K1W22B-7]|uniref:c-type cytochrome n=1 Tax=Solimonas sp. K1W22B-7 TaxID=2303331 RepID=UPI000E335BD2|nr:hypothetical protein [Solimonas sp. K1W22B-7]AXQ31503.1 hypothetical protein D0B54_23700 [Solimonas sp. K1W22B-7]